MNLLKRRMIRPFMIFGHRPWPLTRATANQLDPNSPVEEENAPYYDPNLFYPARLGQVLHGRYQLATKLGYGSSSTVWLARDLNQWRWLEERYVTLKINTTHGKSAENELSILQQISQQKSKHIGSQFIRKLEDWFMLDGHRCFVFEPMREPLWLYCRRFEDDVIPPDILKVIIQMVLHGLDYLHTVCNIIHTDNIMVKFEDTSLLQKYAHDEYEDPLPQKVADDRTIYLSRNNFGPLKEPTGVVQITDFGFSVSGKVPRAGCIQAEGYRAPEVILDAGYSYSADIWSLGAMLWDLLEGKLLFNALESDGYSDADHLAHITALLGPPPTWLLSSGRRSPKLYDAEGRLKKQVQVTEGFGFETSVNALSGTEKTQFIQFVKRMLTWDPLERSTAKELLKDPWVQIDT